MVSFRSARKLSSYLVRAKLYSVERKGGSCKCNCNRCQVCQSISETDTFTCSNDGTTYKINHKFDCNEKCLIYLITCKKCFKEYVGQTVDTLGVVGITTKMMLESMKEANTVCKNIYMNISTYLATLTF